MLLITKLQKNHSACVRGIQTSCLFESVGKNEEVAPRRNSCSIDW